MSAEDARWLLLIHQIPPRPSYFRVKIWRRLQRLGAVGIKSSVYALPATEAAREDLGWVLREIVEGGGDASLVEARFVEGLSDEQVREMFRAARDADYQALLDEARKLRRKAPGDDLRGQVERLRKRVSEVAVIDFFSARGREPLEALLREISARAALPASPAAPEAPFARPQGATWVTRSGVHVDRMACAWLIRRFIDPEARFRFVPGKDAQVRAGEVRFDMYEGEFTHQGEQCTFEVMLRRFRLEDPALQAIAEIVHDVDLKDDRFQRPDKDGIERVVNAIALAHAGDEERLARSGALFDDLYELFRRKRSFERKR
jgi:hypothetical protein